MTLKKNIANSIEYIFIHLDMKGVIIDCTPGVETLYEYSVLELIGQKISKLYIEDTLHLQTILAQVKKVGQWMGEMIATSKSAKKHYHSIILIFRSNNLRKHIGYTLMAKPMNTAEQLQQRSQESLQIRNKELEDINSKMHEISRLKDQFLANMSHDLRTPLNSIIGFAEIMIDEKAGPLSDLHKEYLNDILSSAYHLLLLINDILDLAKIESGKMEFNPVKIRLYLFVDELKKFFNQMITQKHINFDIKIASNFEITIDPQKLKQVLYNLVSNALKFTNKGGSVTIKASKESKNTFRLAVADTGIGIEEKDFKKLFMPFQQLKTEAAMENKGTGLGLAMTRRIVEAQGGTIGVESTFGKGSIFYIILPCFAPKGGYSYIKPLADQTKKVPCVLIIEEETPFRAELVVDLIKIGYEVNVAKNIEEAIAKFKVSKADAIILDFFISDISKWRLLRAFRSEMPFEKAPALLITGGVSNVEAFGFKIHDFLVQPLKSKELVDALQWSGASPHTNKKVLIIDNDKAAIKLTHKILTKLGYDVQFQTDLNKAILHMKKEYPDAIILNAFIESENLNGLDFLQYLRHSKKNRYTPIVITTLKILTQEERERIKGVIQRVLIKKEGIAYSLINEIKKQFPISENSKRTC
jgi:signal transduction histidine kinase/DNA-binding response OmpR family regulator